MKLSVLYSDRMIIVDGVGYRDEELVRGDPNHRAIQWDDRNKSGHIEVYQGDRVWLAERRAIEHFITRHTELAAADKIAREEAEAARKERNRAIMAGEIDPDEEKPA